MSGDLKHPSKGMRILIRLSRLSKLIIGLLAIPKGTLSGLALTFGAYSIVILSMAASISRETFYGNVNIIQDVS